MCHNPEFRKAGRRHVGPALVTCFAALLIALPSHVQAELAPLVPNGGFEAGLSAPWGTGQVLPVDGPGAWKCLSGCNSTATADRNVTHGGKLSLHIVHRTPRAPHVYGTTQQPLTLKPGQRYGISLWAKTNGLRSAGAINVSVDEAWRIRPIQLPAGTYDWTPFTGEFSLPDGQAQLRILSEDVGECWIDDIEISSLEPEPRSVAGRPAVPPPTSPGRTEPVPTNAVPQRLAALLTRVGQFREQALHDIDLALADAADEEARHDFVRLGDQLWPLTERKVGWSYFFSYSLIVPIGTQSSQPRVAFIHPWSDVALVTVWSNDEHGARLEGAEAVPGELLRTPALTALRRVPAWIGDPLFKPAAVATLTARTVADFEETFNPIHATAWRHLPIGRNTSPAAKAECDETCAALLAESLARVQFLQTAQPGEPALLPHLRNQTRAFLEGGAAGRMERLLSTATETLPAARDVLLKLKPERFTRMTAVSILVGRNEGMVFLAPWDEPGLCLSLHVSHTDDRPAITRVDVISFAAAYQQLTKTGAHP